MNLLLYSKFMSFKLCWVLCGNRDFLICLIFFPFIFLPKSQIFQRRERIQYAEALSGFCAKKKRIFSLWNLAQDGCTASLEECTNVKADPLSFQDNREQTERGNFSLLDALASLDFRLSVSQWLMFFLLHIFRHNQDNQENQWKSMIINDNQW